MRGAITFRTGEILRMLRTPPGSLVATRRLCGTRLPPTRTVDPMAGRAYRWAEIEPGWWGPIGDQGAVEQLGGPKRFRCPYGTRGTRLVGLEPHHRDPFLFHVVQGRAGPEAIAGRPLPGKKMRNGEARLAVVVVEVRLERLGEASTYDANAELGTPVGRIDAFQNHWRRELGAWDPDAWSWALLLRWEALRSGVAPAITRSAPEEPGSGLWSAPGDTHLFERR